MLLAAFRDLQFRARRFAITVIGVAMVFAVTLLIAGMSAAFGSEAERTVDVLQLDGWVIGEDANGPFLSATPFGEASLEEIEASPGVEAAGGMAYTRKSIVQDGEAQDLNVVAIDPAGPGMPAPSRGAAPEGEGEIMVSSLLGVDPGETLDVGGQEFEVTGVLNRASALAGVPNVYVTLADGQAIAFAGQPVVTSVAVTGTPDELPAGFKFHPKDDAVDELIRPVADAQSAIALFSVILWLVAALIIGSVIYLSALEREGDFAVFKATGWSNGSLALGLMVQAVLLAILAAAIAAVLATLLAPQFPMSIDLTGRLYITMPIIAVFISLLASLVGLRRITKVDPAQAFG